MLILEGWGVRQDFFSAKKFSQKACDLNDGEGCTLLGILHFGGKGVKKDAKIAKQYFGKGCDLKFQLGCEFYAKLSSMGY